MESALHVPADHPAYAGHFPGRPILPGVVILAEVLASIAAATGRSESSWRISSVKFLHPVIPGTPLTLSHESDEGAIRFEVRSPSDMVATGTLSPSG